MQDILLSTHIPTDISKYIQKVLHLYFASEFEKSVGNSGSEFPNFQVLQEYRSFFHNAEHPLAWEISETFYLTAGNNGKYDYSVFCCF